MLGAVAIGVDVDRLAFFLAAIAVDRLGDEVLQGKTDRVVVLGVRVRGEETAEGHAQAEAHEDPEGAALVEGAPRGRGGGHGAGAYGILAQATICLAGGRPYAQIRGPWSSNSPRPQSSTGG